MIKIEWGDALKTLYDNRATVSDGVQFAWKKLFGVDGKVGFVGPGGSGKSVLFLSITDAPIENEDDLPEKSLSRQEGKMKKGGVRTGIVVSVGQYGRARLSDYETIFHETYPVDIVVFFSNYGFLEPREETTKASVNLSDLSLRE